jgi:hypothetical protein
MSTKTFGKLFLKLGKAYKVVPGQKLVVANECTALTSRNIGAK